MLWLVLGLVLFFGAHLTPAFPTLRQFFVDRLGENFYILGITLKSFLGLGLIIYGASVFRGSPGDFRVWTPPLWARHISFTLMLPAFVLLAATYIPSKIRDAAKHPMLAAVTVWALVHLLANGDLLAFILFGAFLSYSLYARWSLLQRGVAPKKPADGWRGDLIALAGGAAIWALVMFKLHALAGAPLL